MYSGLEILFFICLKYAAVWEDVFLRQLTIFVVFKEDLAVKRNLFAFLEYINARAY